MADTDYALALSLQDEFSAIDNEETRNSGDKRKRPTSIVDDCWETIDPTPDIRELFLQFNDKYFDSKLSCCEVKWAPRMTLCAGVCCYEGRGGLCSIKLSMPLLKLRPRKDLVQTLLHEMIHAFLFVTHNNKDHDSHGPEFHKHMSRINRSSGSNITVYHNFHDEVDLYRQHWWRCNGPCQKRPPYYGMVKRAMNRAPAPRDPWWPDHQRTCGGTYHKIREPEDYGKKKRKKDDGINAENEATKDTPKIYDLWNKESGGKSHKTNSSDSSTNAKPNYSKTSSGNDINTGDLSTNAGGTKIDNFWRVENDDSSGKENDVQKINHAFTPFTGKGHVLGSVQSETSTISVKKQGNTRTVSKGRDFSPPVQGNGQDFQGIKLFLQNTGRLSSRSGHLNRIVTSTQSKSSKAIDITENDFVDDADIDIVQNTSRNPFIKGKESRLGTNLTTESNSSTLNEIEDVSTDTQQKVNSGTQLTIVDAFKNVGDKKVPVVVINETPTKSAVLASVQCPVCLLKVEETRINAHLDACLS